MDRKPDMMKNFTCNLTFAIIALLVCSCTKPIRVIPEPVVPIVKAPGEESPIEPHDTLRIAQPDRDSLLFDTVQVPIARGFEALLIKKGIIRDAVNDGYVSYKEVQGIDSVNVRAQLYDQYDFTSIKGIEYFKKLRYLNVYGSYLDSLDLRKNTRLEYVNCQGITGSGIQDNPTIRYIDVSNCRELRYLDCAVNLLKKLDVTHNPKLETLICHRNSLTELDISGNSELRVLDCRFNKGITRLATDRTTKLTKLAFAYNSITEPLIDKLGNLKELDCSYNQSANSFSAISLKNNVNLEKLDISGSKLSQIDLSANVLINDLIMGQQNNIAEVDLRGLSRLKRFIAHYSDLKSMNLSRNLELEILGIYGVKLESFDLSNNRELKMLFCAQSSNLTILDLRMCKKLAVCFSHNCPNLKTICVDKIPAKDNPDWNTSEWTQYVTDCE